MTCRRFNFARRRIPLCVYRLCSLLCEPTVSARLFSVSVSRSELLASLLRNLHAISSAVLLFCNFLCKYDDSEVHSGSFTHLCDELIISPSDSSHSLPSASLINRWVGISTSNLSVPISSYSLGAFILESLYGALSIFNFFISYLSFGFFFNYLSRMNLKCVNLVTVSVLNGKRTTLRL